MLDNPILYTLSLTLVHFIWQGCLVALFLKLTLTFIPLKNALIRYNIGLLALLANLLFPIITFYILYHAGFDFQANAQTVLPSFVKEFSQAAHYEISASLIEYLPVITVLWFIGVCYLALKLIIDLYKVEQLGKVDVFAAEKSLMHRFNKLALQMNLFRTPTLLISLKAEIPMALGWLKPVVLLPAAMLSGLSSAQLEMLLLHELAHIQRHDYLINFIQTIAEIVLFFHPAVRWVSKQIRNEREYCSDDIAIHHCCNPIAYARALTETVSLCQHHNHQQNRQSIPQMALAASGGDLKQRVVRLVSSGCVERNDKGQWLAGIFIAFTLFLISCQQLLIFSFSDNNLPYLPGYLEPQKVNNNDYLFNTEETIDENQLTVQQSNKVKIVHHSQVIHTGRTVLKGTSISIHTTSGEYLSSRLKKDTSSSPKRLVKAEMLINKAAKGVVKKSNNESNSTDNITIESTNLQSLAVSPKSQVSSTQRVVTNNQENIFDHFQSPNNPYADQISSLANSKVNLTTSAKTPEQPIEQPAQIISSFSPRYPALAKRKSLELEVLVHFTVDTLGYVRNIQIVDQDKVIYFRRSIRVAMKKWRFKPAEYNGKPVDSSMSRLFSFSLAK